MTLKEYMKIHHPENVNDTMYNGGVVACPYMYGEFAHMKLSNNCNIFKSCYDCWNQEYIPKEGEEMGTKKYIIEIPEETSYINAVHTECGEVVRCKTITLDLLKPYETDSLYRDGRRDGQSEVQELICELLEMDYFELRDCFGSKSLENILSTLSYGETREKYDTYMENKIKVGDEITNGENTGYVICVDNASRLICAKLNEYSYPQQINMNNHCYHKTGRHNTKLAEVMREISET